MFQPTWNICYTQESTKIIPARNPKQCLKDCSWTPWKSWITQNYTGRETTDHSQHDEAKMVVRPRIRKNMFVLEYVWPVYASTVSTLFVSILWLFVWAFSEQHVLLQYVSTLCVSMNTWAEFLGRMHQGSHITSRKKRTHRRSSWAEFLGRIGEISQHHTSHMPDQRRSTIFSTTHHT